MSHVRVSIAQGLWDVIVLDSLQSPMEKNGRNPTAKSADITNLTINSKFQTGERTLSSKHNAYAWPAIIEAGIKMVIDLRDCDSSDKLPYICSKAGIGYFHYPVDNAAGCIDAMITLLPQFCETIDRGDFYIACAMGLHRTDIALCTYWIFYAADKGIAPPPIRGYRQEDGHNTNKIMRVLNAMYARMTEINGVEPMPAEVFKERKRIINELSRI